MKKSLLILMTIALSVVFGVAAAQQAAIAAGYAESSKNISVSALPDSKIEELVKALAEAFTSKSLGSLDAERPYVGRVRVVIEHSLAPDNSRHRFEIRQFRTLEQAERWLKSRERGDDGPGRQSRPLLQCRKGVCTFDFEGGILHNNLYLKKVSYGMRKGRPYIKTIWLLDGD